LSEVAKIIADLPLEQLKAVARRVSMNQAETAHSPILALSRTSNSFPLSFAQERLWFIDQLTPDSVAYNASNGMHLGGALSVATLEQTLSEIVRRHETLRTKFSLVDDEPVQIIQVAQPHSLPMVDVSRLSEVEQKVQSLAAMEAQRPFDLSQGPLLRSWLIRLSPSEHVVLLTMHHIISDGWSMGVLVEEVSTLYQAFSGGGLSPLAELRIQYADYTRWQRQYLKGDVLRSKLNYWKKQLHQAPPLIKLATDRPRPPVQSFRGAAQSFRLPAETTEALQEICRERGCTLFMALLAAFKILLHRYTNDEDIVVGTNVANRNNSQLEGLIGLFINNLVLRTRLTGNPSFYEFLEQVRQVCLQAYIHQDVPFEKVVDELRVERTLSYNPLFQALFVLQNNAVPTMKMPGLTLRTLGAQTKVSQFDLLVNMSETPQGLVGFIDYNTDLFNDSTISQMSERFQTLLKNIADNPDQSVGGLSSSKDQVQRLIYAFNDACE